MRTQSPVGLAPAGLVPAKGTQARPAAASTRFACIGMALLGLPVIGADTACAQNIVIPANSISGGSAFGTGASSSVPADHLPKAASDRYDRVAQLEWLFGPRFEPRGFRQPGPASRRDMFMPSREEYSSQRAQRAAERAAQQAAANVPGRPLTKAERAALGSLRVTVAEKLRNAPPAPPTVGPLLITVSLANQKITLYDQGVAIAESPISSGTAEFPTPTGAFSVLQKRWFHSSNIYSGAPMPYMQRLTWSGIALHGGVLPGYPASHGCIRLPEQFAIRLWGTAPPGTRVIISQNDVQPHEISHPALFAPKNGISPSVPQQPPETPPSAPMVRLMEDADFVGLAPVSLMEEIERTLPAVAEITILRGGNARDIQRAASFTNNDASATASVTRVPGKHRVAQLSGFADARDTPDGRDTPTASITIVRGGAPAEIHQVEMPPSRDAAIYSAAPADVPEVVDAGRDDDLDQQQIAPPPMEAPPPAVVAYPGDDTPNPAAQAEPERLAEAVATPPAAISAPATSVVPPSGIELPRNLRPGPLSIYISRAAQRVYVRKGFDALFDLPATVTGSSSTGAFLFTANAPSEGTATFRWTVVAIAAYQADPKKNVIDDSKTLDAARRALDRIQLPEEALTHISELAGVGTTLIVADPPPGKIGPDDAFSVTTSPLPRPEKRGIDRRASERRTFESRNFDNSRMQNYTVTR